MFEYSPQYIVYTFSKDGAVKATLYANKVEDVKLYTDQYRRLCEINDDKIVVYKKISLELKNDEEVSSEDVKAQIHRLEQRVTTLEAQLHLELSKKQIYPKIEFGYISHDGYKKSILANK